MDTLTGSTICSLQPESADWDWVGLLTDAGIVQLLIRRQDAEVHGGLPPAARLEVQGDWLRVCKGDRPWYFIVNRLEVVEPPICGTQSSA